jgi:ABC-type nitrate/sulfonate/bicarbonate transport system substrate-binding protein
MPSRPVALAIACAMMLAPRASIGQSPTVIRAACPPVDNCTPMLYAIHAGLFRRVGLDVQLSAMASGAVITAAVAGGSLDVGMSSMMALVTAHARGVPISLIAPASIYETDKPPELLLVKKDSPIVNARDLRGKTFGTSSLKDILAIATFAWIDQNGGDSSDVKTIEVPLSALLPALDDGRIDATTIQEPRLSEALHSGTVRVLGKPFDAIAKHFLVTAWFTTSGYATANPTVIERFARVMSDASAYANTHPAETAPLLADHSKVDLATIQHSDRETYDQVLKASELQRVIDVAAQYHLIDRTFDANDFINPLVRSK